MKHPSLSSFCKRNDEEIEREREMKFRKKEKPFSTSSLPPSSHPPNSKSGILLTSLPLFAEWLNKSCKTSEDFQGSGA